MGAQVKVYSLYEDFLGTLTGNFQGKVGGSFTVCWFLSLDFLTNSNFLVDFNPWLLAAVITKLNRTKNVCFCQVNISLTSRHNSGHSKNR